MLCMMICTWEPREEKEVRTRSVTWKWPEDVRVISEFYDLQGQRTIFVVDTDAKGLIAARAPWRDIIKFRDIPRISHRTHKGDPETGISRTVTLWVCQRTWFFTWNRKENGHVEIEFDT